MYRTLALSSILLLLLALGACPTEEGDRFASFDDDDDGHSSGHDDDDGAHDDDDGAHDDDDGGHDDDDGGHGDDDTDCPRIEGSIELPANPPSIVAGPLFVGVFDPDEVNTTGVPLGEPLEAAQEDPGSPPFAFSICVEPGEYVVTAVFDINDGQLCSAGDLWASLTTTVPAEGPVDVGGVVLTETVQPGECRDEGKNPDP